MNAENSQTISSKDPLDNLTSDLRSVFKFSFQQIKLHWKEFFLLTFMVWMIMLLISKMPIQLQLPIMAFIYMPAIVSISYLFLLLIKGESAGLREFIDAFKCNYINVVAAVILLTILYYAGVLLLIVPAVIIAIRTVFVGYILIEKKLNATASIKLSWWMTRNIKGKVFKIYLLTFLPVLFLGVVPMLILVIGEIYTPQSNQLPYHLYNALITIPCTIFLLVSFATLYHVVNRSYSSENVTMSESSGDISGAAFETINPK